MLNRSTLDWLVGKWPSLIFLTPQRRGSVFLEYALLAALIGIVGAVGAVFFGEQIKSFFQALGEKTASVTPKK
ncbi:MAG: hypothetical protein RR133_03200 [Kiritimatiellia bacterium]